MTTATRPKTLKRLVLRKEMAKDLMTPNPVSIHEQATLREAAALLTDREINAVPVIDDAGRPVGVLSRADIVRHDRERPACACSSSENNSELETVFERERLGNDLDNRDCTEVRDIMTPTVISVGSEDTALVVVAEMLALKVHRVFVIDPYGILVGVISTFDVLRHLHYEE